jgi:hypothetical protein
LDIYGASSLKQQSADRKEAERKEKEDNKWVIRICK